jgi:hypothetical protein
MIFCGSGRISVGVFGNWSIRIYGMDIVGSFVILTFFIGVIRSRISVGSEGSLIVLGLSFVLDVSYVTVLVSRVGNGLSATV